MPTISEILAHRERLAQSRAAAEPQATPAALAPSCATCYWRDGEGCFHPEPRERTRADYCLSYYCREVETL